MAHKTQIDYCISIKDKLPKYFINRNVLDCGSLDVNGNNRYLFTDGDYLGCDIGKGNNVDLVCSTNELDFKDESFNTIISTECFEHDMFYSDSLKNIVRLLTKGGLFIFTCATDGRKEHGTRRTNTEKSAPLLADVSIEWGDYYLNVNEKMVREAINVDSIFSEYEFKVVNTDLYFYGIKNV